MSLIFFVILQNGKGISVDGGSPSGTDGSGMA